MTRGETKASQVLMQLPSAVQLALSIMYGLSFDNYHVIKLLPKDLELQFHYDSGTRDLVFARFDIDGLRRMTQVFCENKRSTDPEWWPSWRDVMEFFAICGTSCVIPEIQTDEKASTAVVAADEPGIIGHVGLKLA